MMIAPAVPRSTPSASGIYYQFARFYEFLFGPIYTRRIHDTIRALEIPAGAEVLEIGVGTGLSLPAYPSHARVTGVDLSEEMLRQAASKIEQQEWKHVALLPMDALDLKFTEARFDYVMAFHVVSVVSDIDQLMREMVRVCKPGGHLVIINHLRSPRRWLARCMDQLTPLTRHLGWRTDLALEQLLDPVHLKIERRYKTSPRSLFTVVVARRP